MLDLEKYWQHLWRNMDASTDGNTLGEQLLAKYSEPHRYYHTRQHLRECLETFHTTARLAIDPATVEMALWFHDAIYDVHRHDNEEQSAQWARSVLAEAGIPQASVDRISDLILATQHTTLPIHPDHQLLVDIDLSILAASEPRFAEYERQIRNEYSFVPTALFHHQRQAILQTFLDRPQIYSTAHFYSKLEEKARANLCRSIATNTLNT